MNTMIPGVLLQPFLFGLSKSVFRRNPCPYQVATGCTGGFVQWHSEAGLQPLSLPFMHANKSYMGNYKKNRFESCLWKNVSKHITVLFPAHWLSCYCWLSYELCKQTSDSYTEGTTDTSTTASAILAQVPYWIKMRELAQLMDASLKDITSRWEEGRLQACGFAAADVQRLICAIFETTPLRKECLERIHDENINDIWEFISGSAIYTTRSWLGVREGVSILLSTGCHTQRNREHTDSCTFRCWSGD